jgi:hypothetical protein
MTGSGDSFDCLLGFTADVGAEVLLPLASGSRVPSSAFLTDGDLRPVKPQVGLHADRDRRHRHLHVNGLRLDELGAGFGSSASSGMTEP